MAFSNVYYKRTAATAKACYVCYKPSTTVLATINTTDFLYTCPGHLTDPNFATLLGESGGAKTSGVSAEDIAKVKEEWEARQKIKLEKEKAKGKEKDEKDTGDKDKDVDKKASKIPGTHTPDNPTPLTPTPTHQRYSLHRDYFAMRLSDHRKRRQAARAKELAPRLPGAPHGAVAETF